VTARSDRKSKLTKRFDWEDPSFDAGWKLVSFPKRGRTEMNASPLHASQTDGKVSDKAKPDKPDQKPQSDEPTALPSSGEVRVDYKQSPSSPAEDKKIHSRRPLPVVPDRSPNDQ
jgi:hypothetical protein